MAFPSSSIQENWTQIIPTGAIWAVERSLGESSKTVSTLGILAIQMVGIEKKDVHGETFLHFVASLGAYKTYAHLLKTCAPKQFFDLGETGKISNHLRNKISQITDIYKRPAETLKNLIKEKKLTLELLGYFKYFGEIDFCTHQIIESQRLPMLNKTILMALCEKPPVELEIFDELIKSGVDINQEDMLGWTPLMTALEHKASLALIQKLIALKAEVNAAEQMGKTPLLIALENEADLDVIKLLISHGAHVNALDVMGQSVENLILNHPQSAEITAYITQLQDRQEGVAQ